MALDPQIPRSKFIISDPDADFYPDLSGDAKKIADHAFQHHTQQEV